MIGGIDDRGVMMYEKSKKNWFVPWGVLFLENWKMRGHLVDKNTYSSVFLIKITYNCRRSCLNDAEE